MCGKARITPRPAARYPKAARSAQLDATVGHVTAFAEMMTGRHDERLPE